MTGIVLALFVAATPTGLRMPEPIPFDPVALGLRAAAVGGGAAAAVTCSPGYEYTCQEWDPELGGKPICKCTPIPPETTYGTVTPAFYIMNVFYPPPGRGTRMDYATTTKVGSSTSCTQSYRYELGVSAKLGGPVGASFEVSWSRAWGSTSTQQVDFEVTNKSGYSVPSYGDTPNHFVDEIWFIVNPVIEIAYTTGVSGQSVQWTFSATQLPSSYLYFVYAGWLADPSTMPVNVRSFLDSQGITSSYYSELLKADPFAYGATPGQWIDPDRFQLVNTLPYVPLAFPDQSPTVQQKSITHSVTNASTVVRDVTYTAGVKGSFGAVWGNVSSTNSFQWKSSTSAKTSSSSQQDESFFLGQPSYGYSGPTVLRVYVDKVWKTYLFALDYL